MKNTGNRFFHAVAKLNDVVLKDTYIIDKKNTWENSLKQEMITLNGIQHDLPSSKRSDSNADEISIIQRRKHGEIHLISQE